MPRSRVLLIAGSLLFAGVCVRLAFWQLDRLAERRASNAGTLARRALPEIALRGGIPPDSLDGRMVQAVGQYEPRGELVLR